MIIQSFVEAILELDNLTSHRDLQEVFEPFLNVKQTKNKDKLASWFSL